jgi:hypothetical protein
MIAKKPSLPDAGNAEQTRKVDAMSELVAGMLLDDPDATSPPPDERPGSLSGVGTTEPRSPSRPPADTLEEASRKPRLARAVVIALVLALGVLAVVAAVVFAA